MTEPKPDIWALQSARDVDGLIEALSHPDPDVRKRAASALKEVGDKRAIPALEEAMGREPNWQAYANMAAAKAALDRDSKAEWAVRRREIHTLIAMLESDDPREVIAGAVALGELGDPIAVEPLIMLFRDPGSGDLEKLAAAEALIKLNSAPGVVTLLAALRKDEWQVRRNAAAILGQLRATWAVRPLIEVLKDPNPIVRRTAAAALRRIGTDEALAALGESWD